MGAENLSKVFGYTIVGNSVPDQPLHIAATEVAGQQAVSLVPFTMTDSPKIWLLLIILTFNF